MSDSKMFCGNTCDPPKDLRFRDMPNHQKKITPSSSTRLFSPAGSEGEITLSPLHNPAKLSFPLSEQRSLHIRLQSVRGVLVRYARSYFVFGSASLVPSLECDLGENLQASQRALVCLPWLATLFAERQPRCQGSPHIDEPARV